MKTRLLCLLLSFSIPVAGNAAVTLAPLFQDHAVLQRDKPLPVWGKADPGERVSVTFHGQQAAAVAGPDGRWTVSLDPIAASADPADLVVTGRSPDQIVIHDVLIGEVWLCSGQSNMEFTVWNPADTLYRVDNGEKEVAAATFPLIRQFKVERFESDQPVDTAQGSWVACTPETVHAFTAVGYFFARDLYQKLGVPFGIINCTWGGSAIEPWLSHAALASDPAFAAVYQRWQQAQDQYPIRVAEHIAMLQAWATVGSQARARGPDAYAAFAKQFPQPKPAPKPDKPYPYAPSKIFNGMVHPLLPYALRGALWYQGEANVGRAQEYHKLLAAMITSWRADFGQGDFPFYWVQLPNYNGREAVRSKWSYLREAQAQTLTLPETGMAVTIDIGEKENLHPRNKQEVGRRLALIAKAKVYGLTVDFSGPVFLAAERTGSAMLVHFQYAAMGLTAAGKPPQSFEVAGADRIFYPADATIVRRPLAQGGADAVDQVLVQSSKVSEPVAVRYAWSNAPEANLYNGAGLPAAPFRSDSW
jgi:sialate O-acetylesterase